MKANSHTWSTASIRPGDVGFLRSWFEQNLGSSERAPGRINWGAILGLALCLAVSAGFWAAMVFFAARIWK